MVIAATCPSCGQRAQFPEALRGRRLACPRCGQLLDVAVAPAAPEASAKQPDADVSPVAAAAPAGLAPEGVRPRSAARGTFTALPPPPRPPQRYLPLRTIAMLSRLVGVIALVLGVTAMYIILSEQANAQLIAWLPQVAWVFVAALASFAGAEILHLFLGMEENTRYTNELLYRLWADRHERDSNRPQPPTP